MTDEACQEFGFEFEPVHLIPQLAAEDFGVFGSIVGHAGVLGLRLLRFLRWRQINSMPRRFSRLRSGSLSQARSAIRRVGLRRGRAGLSLPTWVAWSVCSMTVTSPGLAPWMDTPSLQGTA